ncbi:MAG: adenylyltransferase [Spirochaetes bacterium RBG_13_51_14]|nr:MAG: adenylyltransferase [Spirochaetes bacterium RBG_13_51_14]
MLNPEELMIYSRHLGIDSWGTVTQERLKKKRVFVAGAGGLGSPVLYYLAAAGIGNLVLCDFDRVDATNLNRQILHRFGRIGAYKVDSAKQSLLELNPFVTISPLKEKLTGRNAVRLVGNSDIIVDCLDNFESRHILNIVSVTRNIPMIHAGVSEFRGQITFLHPPETPCLACFITEKKSRGVNNIVGAAPGVIGSMQAVEAIKYLAGFGATLKNRLVFWDGLTMKFETVLLKRNPRCRVCKNR